MSSKNVTTVEYSGFATRLVEVCGSDQPAEIARMLNMSYQAVKNYLQGRLPEAGVLIAISERTPYSIHWLLTGHGDKLIANQLIEGTPVLSDQITSLIKDECRKNVGEMLSHSKVNAQEKVIVLRSEDVKEEKAVENFDAPSKKR